MAAMAQAAHYEKSIDLANKKAMVTLTTVVKDRTLFTFGQRKIKKFDGSNPDLWPVFEDKFNALINSYKDSDVSDVEKFTLLR